MSNINVRIEYLIHTLVVNGSTKNDISTEVNNALQKAIDTLDEKGSTVIINHLVGNLNVLFNNYSKANHNLLKQETQAILRNAVLEGQNEEAQKQL